MVSPFRNCTVIPQNLLCASEGILFTNPYPKDTTQNYLELPKAEKNSDLVSSF